jgi:hypothetical protein
MWLNLMAHFGKLEIKVRSMSFGSMRTSVRSFLLSSFTATDFTSFSKTITRMPPVIIRNKKIPVSQKKTLKIRLYKGFWGTISAC